MGKKINSFKNSYAVSEIVGGMFLIVIAVIAFSAIYLYLYPQGPDLETSVKLEGYVGSDGSIILCHNGGETLSNYRVIVRDPDGGLIGSKTVNDDEWKIGEKRYPLTQLNITDVRLVNETVEVSLGIYNLERDGSSKEIFNGIFTGKVSGGTTENPFEEVMLISSLYTDTTDEDLICFNNTIEPNITAKTFIYNWLVDGESFCEVYLPFDTSNNNTAKDYSNNNNNGTVVGPIWNSQGVVGGCYFFDGSSDYINGPITDVLGNVEYNDFSVSLWLKSSDITAEWKVLMEARYDNKNFVRIFQQGNEIHFGITEDGTKYVIRTDNLTSNTWYHITGVWDASEKLPHIYVDGVESNKTGNRNFPFGAHDGFNIGHGTSGSGGFWYGYVDEFQIFDRALSNEQIYQIYISTKDGESDKSVMVAEETIQGETWQCIVTPNDSSQDDTAVESNTLQITSYGGG